MSRYPGDSFSRLQLIRAFAWIWRATDLRPVFHTHGDDREKRQDRRTLGRSNTLHRSGLRFDIPTWRLRITRPIYEGHYSFDSTHRGEQSAIRGLVAVDLREELPASALRFWTTLGKVDLELMIDVLVHRLVVLFGLFNLMLTLGGNQNRKSSPDKSVAYMCILSARHTERIAPAPLPLPFRGPRRSWYDVRKPLLKGMLHCVEEIVVQILLGFVFDAYPASDLILVRQMLGCKAMSLPSGDIGATGRCRCHPP